MPDQKGRSFCEVGCGSGVLSTFAALQGATRICAVDINPYAIESTKANLSKYKIKNFDVLLSDVFENVKGTFDTINFAAPYHGNEPKEILEYGVSDPGYRALKKFLGEAKNYLNKGGQVVLGFSDTGDVNLLNELIIENYYFVKKFAEEENDGWKAYLYVLESLEFTNQVQKYIYDSDYKWFKEYKQLILKGRLLKVGYGFGYSPSFIKLYNKDITSVDIVVNRDGINPQDVVVYDGKSLPFQDNSFDTVICTYTLHHISNPEFAFSEIARVSKKTIVIVEETYDNLFQKVSTVINCWLVNKKAAQKVEIILGSYFSRKSIRNLFRKLNLSIVNEISESKKSFFAEFFVLTK